MIHSDEFSAFQLKDGVRRVEDLRLDSNDIQLLSSIVYLDVLRLPPVSLPNLPWILFECQQPIKCC